MSVKTISEEDKLTLIVDKGDRTKLMEVLQKWNFVSEQAFLRFVVSLLLVTEDKVLWIKDNDKTIRIEPADHSIKNK